MDGAAPDTRLNAQRKAYTAARSDARSTRELAEKVREDAVERESFDPFFTFFLGGLAAFEGETRVGAVGVSGLPGEVDEALARQALEAAGLSLVRENERRLAAAMLEGLREAVERDAECHELLQRFRPALSCPVEIGDRGQPVLRGAR